MVNEVVDWRGTATTYSWGCKSIIILRCWEKVRKIISWIPSSCLLTPSFPPLVSSNLSLVDGFSGCVRVSEWLVVAAFAIGVRWHTQRTYRQMHSLPSHSASVFLHWRHAKIHTYFADCSGRMDRWSLDGLCFRSCRLYSCCFIAHSTHPWHGWVIYLHTYAFPIACFSQWWCWSWLCFSEFFYTFYGCIEFHGFYV